MPLIGSMWDRVEAELTSADLPALLSDCAAKGISIQRVSQLDSLTITICVSKKDIAKLKEIAQKTGSSFRIRKKIGLFYEVKRLKNRPVLLGSVMLLLFATLWLPERVLFLQVEGNQRIPSGQILEIANSCGIVFGASRRQVRSENMKNKLLERMPQLQWAGINTKGCTAVITVREREEDTSKARLGSVVSLIASRDGIVQSGTATAGTLLCKPGQVVQAGDVLVSGYTDCGISVRAERAKGEVFALTVRPITVATPLNYLSKGDREKEIKKYSLVIGKKHIFLSKDSGISYTTCDKIRREYILSLPGGFRLPVTLSVETLMIRKPQETGTLGTMAGELSMKAAKEYLQNTMVSGSVLDFDVSEEIADQLYQLHGNFLCNEMIARERNEEIIEEYGKNSGEGS